MKFTRKEFLRTGTLITGGFLFQGHKIFDLLQTKTLGIKQLRNGYGIFLETGGTIGWHLTKDAFVVIDSQFPNSAKNFMTEMKKKTSRKIDLFFNTHHHSDHTGGNGVIKDYARKMIAHEKCVFYQKDRYGNNPDQPQVYASTTFTDEWQQKIDKEIVTAKYFGAAHTGGDAVIHFEKANIAHIGDLVFNKTYPYIDLYGGGSLSGWIEVLEKAHKYFSKDTLFIYGHGATNDMVTGSLNDLLDMRNLITVLIDFVTNEKSKGKSRLEISLSTDIPGTEGWKERVPGFLRVTLERVYDELAKKS